MNNIKYFRQKAGLSVYQLSTGTGLSPSYISYLENGQRRLTESAKNSISSALNIDSSQLVADNPESLFSPIIKKCIKCNAEFQGTRYQKVCARCVSNPRGYTSYDYKYYHENVKFKTYLKHNFPEVLTTAEIKAKKSGLTLIEYIVQSIKERNEKE
jgi:transcriptional regulator with XRE-family HTH domain